MRRCRYCQRDITPIEGTAWWKDAEGFKICSQGSDFLRVHIPLRESL